MKSPSKNLKKFYTVKDLVERWDMSRPTVLNFIKDGKLKFLLKGRGNKKWVLGSEVERFENGR